MAFQPNQLDVLHSEVSWRCTIAIGAAGEATLVGFSDPGGSVAHDTDGQYTLIFPEAATAFPEAMTYWDTGYPSGDNGVGIRELTATTITLHTSPHGTPGVDPTAGSRIFVSLILRNP